MRADGVQDSLRSDGNGRKLWSRSVGLIQLEFDGIGEVCHREFIILAVFYMEGVVFYDYYSVCDAEKLAQEVFGFVFSGNDFDAV